MAGGEQVTAYDIAGVPYDGATYRVSANFNRPADTNVYAVGDLVANSTTAGSVVPMQFAVGITARGGEVRRARLRKSGTGTGVTAAFRLHLYSASPIVSNGDNGPWLTDKAANYVGSIDITCDRAFTDGAAGNGVPNVGNEINFTALVYYGLLEARGANVLVNAENINVELEIRRN